MTSRSRGRAVPRCHPDCKSKVVLDSICNSSHIMKSCLKNEPQLEKYFTDEEFETSHWPCERCLEALKSVKMFWKIIVEKIFFVNIPKDDVLDQKRCGTETVRSVAKVWQSEMTQQAMFVKNISYLNRPPNFPSPCVWEGNAMTKDTTSCNNSSSDQDHKNNDIIKSEGKTDCRKKITMKSFKVKSTDTDCLSNPLVHRSNRTGSSLNSRRHSRCSTKAKMVDMGCDCNKMSEEMNAQKTLLLNLQEKCNCQKQEIDKLTRENSSLRIELQNIYKNSSRKTTYFTPSRSSSNNDSQDSIAILPKPFECFSENCGDSNQVKGVESEMIITMKNGKNKNYGHISLLQVLHKTNSPNLRELSLGRTCSNKKEDPIELLTKVQNTFGAIVEREMGIANKNELENKCNIDAVFNKVNACKSAPSCSTTTLASSDSHFERY
ncbi:hypothetical protein PYW07_000855 [Mythimna separata]|uniref:Uncharacterized protein n=1 Tax=Mythimna separata TaxID=271217 RepID=A0AAD7YRZ0_MYTSE|nr:hypothetical protein PYW07_000855 [Mythimna separata]